MSGAAKINFDVTNMTGNAAVVPTGIIFLQGQSKRGPFNDPSEVINGWPRFVELYGGLSSNTLSPLLVKRYLDKGGRLRFSRLNSISNQATVSDQTFSTLISFSSAPANNSTIKIDGPNGAGLDVDMVFTTTSEYYNVMETYLKSLDDYVGYRRVKSKLGNTIPDDIYVYTKENLELDADSSTAPIEINNFGNTFKDSTGNTEILSFKSKYAGSDYNNVRIDISPASNGNDKAFNIYVIHNIEPTINETYTNLSLNNVVSLINDNSNLVEVEIIGSYTALTEMDKKASFLLKDGSDAQLTPSDYIGDSNNKTGFYSFDDYEDSYYLTTFDELSDENRNIIDAAADAYLNNRGDLVYPILIEEDNKQDIIEKYNNKLIDSKFVFPLTSGGGLKVLEPLSNTQILISPVADVLANAVNSDNRFGPWYSFAGPNRGIITNTFGVNTNFGTISKKQDLNDLADNNINTVILRDGSVKLWGNFSGQKQRNQERYLNVVKLVIFIKRALRPLLEPFLEEPNDIPTWQNIYYTIEPLFEELKNRRAIYSYDWSGDQFAKSMNDLMVNKVSDVTQGKYKVILSISAISSLQEINIGIFLTEAGLEFQTIDNQLNQ